MQHLDTLQPSLCRPIQQLLLCPDPQKHLNIIGFHHLLPRRSLLEHQKPVAIHLDGPVGRRCVQQKLSVDESLIKLAREVFLVVYFGPRGCFLQAMCDASRRYQIVLHQEIQTARARAQELHNLAEKARWLIRPNKMTDTSDTKEQQVNLARTTLQGVGHSQTCRLPCHPNNTPKTGHAGGSLLHPGGTLQHGGLCINTNDLNIGNVYILSHHIMGEIHQNTSDASANIKHSQQTRPSGHQLVPQSRQIDPHVAPHIQGVRICLAPEVVVFGQIRCVVEVALAFFAVDHGR